jgi:polysaccharide chain length determinant protein (PEP-CTERM system associated)
VPAQIRHPTPVMAGRILAAVKIESGRVRRRTLVSNEDALDREEESGKTLSEHLAGLRRHKGLILGVAALVAAAAFVAAVTIPPVYRSSASVLVQEQEVPPDLVRSTITSFADERIQVISQQVMTRAVLLDLVDKYGLYEERRKRETPQEIVERMRRDITLSTVDASVSDRSSGRRVNTTIAFRISYDSPDPQSAQKVVEELVSLYLSENAKVRQESISQTAVFLAQEADRAAKQIQEIEANLAEFKRRYADRMPDSSGLTIQLADRTQSEIQGVEREISVVHDRKLSLESQLSLIKPNAPPAISASGERMLSPEERLRALQAQHATATAQFHDTHPDVRRLQREIAALKDQIAASGSDSQKVGDGKGSAAAQKPDNPAYVSLTTQLESTRRELLQLSALRDDLRAKQRAYDARLQQIPEIEREYRDLTRDYDNAQARYREVKTKLAQAEVAQELEKDRKAERFTLGEPANLPERPIRPNRSAIALTGLVASVGGGVGLAWLRELLDHSIKGPLELARFVSVPILTAIPYIETRSERARQQRRRRLIVLLSAILLVAFIASVHLWLKPIPDVWDGVLRRIGM